MEDDLNNVDTAVFKRWLDRCVFLCRRDKGNVASTRVRTNANVTCDPP